MFIIKNGLTLRQIYDYLLPILEDTKLEVIRKLILILPEEIIFDISIARDHPSHLYTNITMTTRYRTNDFTPYLKSIEDGYKFHQMVFRDGSTLPDVGSLYDNTYTWHLYQDKTEVELFIMRCPDKQFIEEIL